MIERNEIILERDIVLDEENIELIQYHIELPRLIDNDVIDACNCNSHLVESLRESQKRIFLSK